MSGFDIVIVISVILFARLGVRLVSKYLQMKKEKKDDVAEPWTVFQAFDKSKISEFDGFRFVKNRI